MSDKILVTGAAGQLGRAIKRVFDALAPTLDVVYATREDLDLLDDRAVMNKVRQGGFSHIINAAGYTAVDKAETDREAATAGNVIAPKNLATAAAAAGTRLIHISTDYVYDGMSDQPYRETDRANPLQFYGLTKLKGEECVRDLCPDAVIVRTQWLYGLQCKNFVETMIALSDRMDRAGEIAVVTDQKGSPTRADDLAEALLKIISAPRWVAGIYHYSSEGETSWHVFASEIMRLYASKTEIKPILTKDYPSAAHRPLFSVLSKESIKSAYGVRIPHWRDSLADYMVQRTEISKP